MKFNLITLLGIILLVMGTLGLLGMGIPMHETVIDAGPIDASVERERTVPMAISGVLLVLGLGMAFVGQVKG